MPYVAPRDIIDASFEGEVLCPFADIPQIDRFSLSIDSQIGIFSLGFEAQKLYRLLHLIPVNLYEKLAGQVVIELGACNEYGYLFAEHVKAGAYVGIEPFIGDATERKIRLHEEKREDGIPWCVLHEDALSVVERLPRASVSFLLLGFNADILPSESYVERLCGGMAQSLSKTGVIFSFNSWLLENEADFQKEVMDVEGGCIHCCFK